MSTKFTVEPAVLTQTGKLFSDQVGEIDAAAVTGQDTDFGATANTGKAYAAEGAAFHKSLLTFVQTVMSPMAAKTTWVGQTLTATAADYRKREDDNHSRVTRSGKGA